MLRTQSIRKNKRLIARVGAYRAESSGFTLVELLVTALIVTVAILSVGVGFAKLSALEETNREKALVLEELCIRAAIMQPRVAIGAAATNTVVLSTNQPVVIRYPKIIFGVAFETNQYLQVTNYVIGVQNGTLQGQVLSAKETNNRPATVSYNWQDVIFIRQSRQSMVTGNRITNISNGVLMCYAADAPSCAGTDTVSLVVPVRLQNQAY